MKFIKRIEKGVVVFDGAMGTQIQAAGFSEADYDGKTGCCEILNITGKDRIGEIHSRYLQAGADVIETNTFGGSRLVLEEYGLGERTEEINRIAAGIARQAADKAKGRERFVAGSMGPGTRLPSLDQVSFDELFSSYVEQATGLIRGGVDLFMLETCQDPLQVKAGVIAIQEAMDREKTELPVFVSVTVETNGTLLVGTDLQAAVSIVTPLGVQGMGLNCSMGPDSMGPYVRELCSQFPGHVLVMPNAGLPKNVNGSLVYDMTSEEFVSLVLEFVKSHGVGLVGGCCGTSPEFIKRLSEEAENVKPAPRNVKPAPSVASLFLSQNLKQDPAPFFIGERANTNGSKKFRTLLLADDWDGMVSVAARQQKSGAHSVDLCVAYTGRDEAADMSQMVGRVARQVQPPLVIDTTSVDTMESALKKYGGRPIINSINLEEGEERVSTVCRLAKKYGAALIALAIDEKGMAKSVDRKVDIAKRIFGIAVEKHGMNPGDLLFDMLTFTLGSGDETLKDAAINTIEAIRRIKKELPGVFTVLGVSNISFGLKPKTREVLNSVFMGEAVEAGLDAAIVNVKKIIPLYRISDEDKNIAMDLVYNRKESALLDYIRHFEDKQPGDVEQAEELESLTPEEQLARKIMDGEKSGLEDLLDSQREKTAPVEIINTILVPAMKEVGTLFGAGKMQLPFVLQSAEVMKTAVSLLEPHMEQKEDSSALKMLLATVKGDVHDIGKNLVDIIFTNNGYRVLNIGVKCDIADILKKAQEEKADVIGMSGLLVKSTQIMKENIEEMKARNINIPVLLGGAALTRSYVEEICDPILDAPVIYCADAFDGLSALEQMKDGNLDEFLEARKQKTGSVSREGAVADSKGKDEEKIREAPVPGFPFKGVMPVEGIACDDLVSRISEKTLFEVRWGYRTRGMSDSERTTFIREKVRPEYDRLLKKLKDEAMIEPRGVYGYFPVRRDGNNVIVSGEELGKGDEVFPFPRQSRLPNLCLSDFISTSLDVLPVFAVTVGEAISKEALSLFKAGKYKDYLLLHGIAAELAEAMAGMVHEHIGHELSLKGKGKRYSFGFSSCPDLEQNKKLLYLLNADTAGIRAEESGGMVPVYSVSAFVLHHPQARYFSHK